ncbi:MAG TPA: fumarylacetoacetate hydrolase [Solibacterales bacterium]|nr:fumarylacetoacetate hydrolase [Bryobacterales bacterium]
MPRYVRFLHQDQARYGREQDGLLYPLERAPWLGGGEAGPSISLAAVTLLAPCEPRTIFAVGLNYRSHLGQRPAPRDPEIFYKPVSALQHPGGPIVIPPEAEDVHFEGEMVAVIGREVRHASLDQARDAIFGLTCGNDVSDRNWQRGAGKDLQWWRAKGADTFAPLGPAVVTDLDPADRLLQTRVNGEMLQSQETSDLLFAVPEIIRWISRWVTLTPGDLIYTGTPGNTRRLVHGDVVEVELEGIGVLRNPVIAATPTP